MLVHHLLVMGDGGFGVTPKEFRSLAFEYASSLGKEALYKNEEVSYKYQYAFLKHHPEIYIIKPEEMSLYRFTAPSQTAVDVYFHSLQNLYQKYQMTPDRIFNVDETGVFDQPKATKVFMHTNGYNIQVVAGERGQLTTVLAFASANGDQSTPIIIMKGMKVQPAWKTYLPEDWVLLSTESGYISKETFIAAGRHFLKFLESKKLLGKHCILLLDGHPSHSYNYAFNLMMASHNIHVVQFPAHCTHFLQPYDACILAALKKCWENAVRF